MATNIKANAATDAAVSQEITFPPNRVSTPQREWVPESGGQIDLTGLPIIGPFLTRILKSRKFQFSIIVPSQILFWLVVISGFIGTMDPMQNFATAITWFIWFSLMFPLTLFIGRAWCLTCPFGGFGEWIQRHTFWKRTQKALGLGIKMPDAVAKYGLLTSAGIFIILSWFEEYFNLAGPGVPYMTSAMVLGIIAFSVGSFLIFERRSFCRYLCPLSSLIGAAGATGVISGFRPKNQEVCTKCQTKDCMRGGEHGYGCPWYTYPATADTNTYCGICSECYKACPNDNVGLYAQKPLTSVITPKKRNTMAWVIAALFGLVIFQQWNALGAYGVVDDWLNNVLHFPGYPNPVDYFLTILAVVGIFAGTAYLLSRAFSIKTQIARSFNSWFAPFMYGLIPILGADFLARIVPKFFNHAARLASSILGVFGTQVSWADMAILPNDWVVRLQYIVVGIGAVLAIYSTSKIAGKDYKDLTQHNKLVRLIPAIFVVALGAGVIALYFFMNGAE